MLNTKTQDARLNYLEEIMVSTAKTQTETLRLLKGISERVEQNSARLDAQAAILTEHSEILMDHSKRLENLERLMTQVLEELVAIKEILASPRGIGFVPESDDSD